MILQRQPQLQGSHDSPNYQPQQRPNNLLGEVYFDFHAMDNINLCTAMKALIH